MRKGDVETLKNWRVEYYDGDSGVNSNETLKAKSIVQGYQIAQAHARETGLRIRSIKEIEG